MSIESEFRESPNPLDHVVLSVDTSNVAEAGELVDGFREAGGRLIKLGWEFSTIAGGPRGMSEFASELGMRWIYDAKIGDISNTMSSSMANVMKYPHPPVGITSLWGTSQSGMESLQEAAGETPIFGVTLLTDISPREAIKRFGTEQEKYHASWLTNVGVLHLGENIRKRIVVERASDFAQAGIRGLVASPKELNTLNAYSFAEPLIKLIPGTRSAHAHADDQQNVTTPEEAIANGADLVVVGRQYIGAEDRAAELDLIRQEVERGFERRAT